MNNNAVIAMGVVVAGLTGWLAVSVVQTTAATPEVETRDVVQKQVVDTAPVTTSESSETTETSVTIEDDGVETSVTVE